MEVMREVMRSLDNSNDMNSKERIEFTGGAVRPKRKNEGNSARRDEEGEEEEGRKGAGDQSQDGDESIEVILEQIEEMNTHHEDSWLFTPTSPMQKGGKVEDLYQWLYKDFNDPQNVELSQTKNALVNKLDSLNDPLDDDSFTAVPSFDVDAFCSPPDLRRKWEPVLEAWDDQSGPSKASSPRRLDATVIVAPSSAQERRLDATVLVAPSSAQERRFEGAPAAPGNRPRGIPQLRSAFGEDFEGVQGIERLDVDQDGISTTSFRKAIDTRTFTRPKRSKPPMLNTLVDPAGYYSGQPHKQLLDQPFDQSPPSDTNSFSPPQPTPPLQSPPALLVDLNTTFDVQAATSQTPPKANYGFNDTFGIDQSPGFSYAGQVTVKKRVQSPTNQVTSSPSRSAMHSPPKQGGPVLRKLSYTLDRPMLASENSEEDRLSSASDSSFSHRLVDMDDVQTAARIQEESLKEEGKSSTPQMQGTGSARLDAGFSPIISGQGGSPGATSGYSSPADEATPYGSQEELELGRINPRQGLVRRTGLALPVAGGNAAAVKGGIHKSMPNLASRLPNGFQPHLQSQRQGQPSYTNGLRLKSHVSDSKLPNPTSGGTQLPRRGLQPPRVYSAVPSGSRGGPGSGISRMGYAGAAGEAVPQRRAMSAQPPLSRPALTVTQGQSHQGSAPQKQIGQGAASRTGGGIPRPPSKLPAPRGRSGLPMPGNRTVNYGRSKPAHNNWMDGCY